MPAPHHGSKPSRRHVLFAASAAAALTALPVTPVAAAESPGAAESVPTPPLAPSAPTPALTPFPLSAVRLLESPFLANMRRTCAYLLFVDIDRLLHTFRLNVGLPSAAEPCGGCLRMLSARYW